MAVLELNPVSAKGKSLNLIKIASAYGKDTNPQGLINKSKIVYIEPNKKRTNNWLKLNRLQLPLVNQSGSKNSITKNNNTVNSNILENVDNDTKSESKNKADVKKSAEEFSKVLGVKINVYESDSSIRGYYQNGEIFINESWVNKKANSSSEFNFVLAHELTHSLEESKHYNQLKEFILDSRIYDDSLKSRDTTHTEEVTKRQELYEKYGKELTTEQAEQELIADFIADELLTNEESIKELAYKDKKLFVKVKEFVNKLIERIKNFSNKSSDITQAQKDLIHIKELYNKAFKDVKENGTYSNEIKYSKKLGGYNPEINVTTDNVLKEYGIKNINNKYEVINKVAHKLENNYLSTDKISKPITNIDTGIKIEIRKSGLRETFGNDRYYLNLSKQLKLAKIASMSELAKMIKYGEVRAKDASNYHNPKSKVRFSYLKSSINIDGVDYEVTMDIKRLPSNENVFYIHNLNIKKEKTNSQAHYVNLLTENLPSNNNISQKNSIVNNSILENSDNDTKTESQKELREFVNENYDVLKKAYDIMEKFNALENEQNNGSDSGNSVDNQGESGIIKARKEIRKSVEIPQNCKHLLDAETNFEGKDISTDILTAIDKTIDDRLKEKSDFRFDEIKVAKFNDNSKSVFITDYILGAHPKNNLYLNMRYFNVKSENDINIMCNEYFNKGWWKSKSLSDLVNHEIMHARINYNNTYEKVERLYQTLCEDKRVKGFCGLVDRYPDEFLNEVYVALNNGEKVDKKYIDVYNEYLKEFLGG